MELNELGDLGLSHGQIKVYQALLELGISGVEKIQEKTGLERRAIYDTLNKLIEKGLASYVKEKNKRRYQITNPRHLKEQIEEKEKNLEKLKEKIPKITELFNYKKPLIDAQIYRGNEAMKSLLNEALNYEATYWIGGNSGVEQASEDMNLWFKRWTIKRIEQKRLMYDLVDKGTYLQDLNPKDTKKHKKSFYKYCELPKNLQSPMVIIMFGKKVAQVLWGKQSFAFVLESEEVKESFMKYFNYFWKEPA